MDKTDFETQKLQEQIADLKAELVELSGKMKADDDSSTTAH